MFKKVIMGLSDKKVLFYYHEVDNFIELVSIKKSSRENWYDCFEVEIKKSDVDFDNIESSLLDLLYYNSEYTNQGESLYSLLEDIAEELQETIPTLVEDVNEIENELLIFD